jgi:hypothetical protein
VPITCHGDDYTDANGFPAIVTSTGAVAKVKAWVLIDPYVTSDSFYYEKFDPSNTKTALWGDSMIMQFEPQEDIPASEWNISIPLLVAQNQDYPSYNTLCMSSIVFSTLGALLDPSAERSQLEGAIPVGRVALFGEGGLEAARAEQKLRASIDERIGTKINLYATVRRRREQPPPEAIVDGSAPLPPPIPLPIRRSGCPWGSRTLCGCLKD